MSKSIWTLGHSTRSIEELVEVLSAYDIELVADVRRFPGSRHSPQFMRNSLETALGQRNIAYAWLPELGGRRRPSPTSINVGWRNAAFRGYADHVATEEFATGLFDLLMLAQGLNTAVMCAELLWWRCHRRIIADVLMSLEFPVIHIRDAEIAEPHRLVAPARMVRGRLTYPMSPSS